MGRQRGRNRRKIAALVAVSCVLGTAAIVLIMAHEPNQAVGLEHIFKGLSILILLAIPPIFLIPNAAGVRPARRGATRMELAE